MKTTKILAMTAITTAALLSLASTYAYKWENNQINNKFTSEQNSSNKKHSKAGKYIQNKKNSENTKANNIANIEKQNLDETETDLLKKQYEEEMMANELYNYFYEIYWTKIFQNIATSEAKHMEAVKVLLDRYEIETPTTYEHIQTLYDELKEKWEKSLKDALEVWISIEIVDIEDIKTAIASTDNEDMKTIFTNIWSASYNHMSWFVRNLENNWFDTDIDYSDYLGDDSLKKRKWNR